MNNFQKIDEPLNPIEEQSLLKFIAAPELQLVERYVRGKYDALMIEAGELNVLLLEGKEGVADQITASAKEAVRYKNFLDVVKEIRSNRPKSITKIKN